MSNATYVVKKTNAVIQPISLQFYLKKYIERLCKFWRGMQKYLRSRYA